MTRLKFFAPLAIVLSALFLSACQSKSASDNGYNEPEYGWDAKHGGGGP